MVGKKEPFPEISGKGFLLFLIDHFAQFIEQAVDTFHQFVAKESIMFFTRDLLCFSAGWFAIS